MSLSSVRPYVRSRLEGLGYTEWADGFNYDNIPETILDRSFHVFIESISGGSINQADQETVAAIILRVFFRGYRDASEAIDQSISGLETIVKDVCKASNRTSVLTNVVFDGADFEPLTVNNDSSVLLTIRLGARVIIGVEE